MAPPEEHQTDTQHQITKMSNSVSNTTISSAPRAGDNNNNNNNRSEHNNGQYSNNYSNHNNNRRNNPTNNNTNNSRYRNPANNNNYNDNRTRSNTDNRASNPPSNTSTAFKGATAGMNGHIFGCHEDKSDRRQYLKTVTALQQYSSKLPHSDNFQSLFKTNPTIPVVAEPTSPGRPDARTEVQELIFRKRSNSMLCAVVISVATWLPYGISSWVNAPRP